MVSRELMSGERMQQAIDEMAESLAALASHPEKAALVGIRTRGALLARRVQTILRERHGWNLPLGILDITLYRDDLSQLASNPLVQKTDLEFDVNDRTILLIDDVIYTGRTVRCALQEILDYGRPHAIRLGVLVDRDGRELPIQPDLVMLREPAAPNQVIKVMMSEVDENDRVLLADRHGGVSTQ